MNDGSGGGKDNGADSYGDDNDNNNNNDNDDDNNEMPLPLCPFTI